jgi:hypothetical protein
MLLDPLRPCRTLDRLIIHLSMQMMTPGNPVSGSTGICLAGNNQNQSKLSAPRRNFRAKAPGILTPVTLAYRSLSPTGHSRLPVTLAYRTARNLLFAGGR